MLLQATDIDKQMWGFLRGWFFFFFGNIRASLLPKIQNQTKMPSDFLKVAESLKAMI